MTVAVTFLDALERSPRFALVRVAPEVEGTALRWLRKHHEREYSLVHAASFEAMRRRRIRDALAFGGSFRVAVYFKVLSS